MVEGLDGVGDAITGGLIGRAIEPTAGEGRHGGGGTCLNCGTSLIGDYCHHCGQTGHIHRALTAWWHDLAHGVLHLDGKIWRTLPLLALRPGDLTRRYVEGERARFVSPMALFLFSVFLMFAVFSSIGGPVAMNTAQVNGAEAAQEFRAERAGTEKKLATLKEDRAKLAAAGAPTATIDDNIASLENELKILSVTGNMVGGGVPIPDDDTDRKALNVNSGWPQLDSAVEKASANPALLFYKIQTNAYKFSWALIPISVPFLWLLFFWKRRYHAYDHTVFVTYSLAFMTLGVVALSLLRPFGLGTQAIVLTMLIVPPIHMYRQLRGAYQLSRFGALWRTVMLVNFAFVAAGLFFALLVALGALT